MEIYDKIVQNKSQSVHINTILFRLEITPQLEAETKSPRLETEIEPLE